MMDILFFFFGCIFAILVGMFMACHNLTGTYDVYRLVSNPDYWAFAILNDRYRNVSLGGIALKEFTSTFRLKYISQGFSFPWENLADDARTRIMNMFAIPTVIHSFMGKTQYTYEIHKRTMVEIDETLPPLNHIALNDYLMDGVKIDTASVAVELLKLIGMNSELIRWGCAYYSIEDSGRFVPMSFENFAQMITAVYPSFKITRSTIQRGVKEYNDYCRCDIAQVQEIALRSNLRAKRELDEFLRKAGK